jgi:hypothetical protein
MIIVSRRPAVGCDRCPPSDRSDSGRVARSAVTIVADACARLTERAGRHRFCSLHLQKASKSIRERRAVRRPVTVPRRDRHRDRAVPDRSARDRSRRDRARSPRREFPGPLFASLPGWRRRSVCQSLSTSHSGSRRGVRPAIVPVASSPAVIDGPVLYD